jgi:hypothetical protein
MSIRTMKEKTQEILWILFNLSKTSIYDLKTKTVMPLIYDFFIIH